MLNSLLTFAAVAMVSVASISPTPAEMSREETARNWSYSDQGSRCRLQFYDPETRTTLIVITEYPEGAIISLHAADGPFDIGKNEVVRFEAGDLLLRSSADRKNTDLLPLGYLNEEQERQLIAASQARLTINGEPIYQFALPGGEQTSERFASCRSQLTKEEGHPDVPVFTPRPRVAEPDLTGPFPANREPIPISPARWVLAYDYPKTALLEGQEGMVRVQAEDRGGW